MEMEHDNYIGTGRPKQEKAESCSTEAKDCPTETLDLNLYPWCQAQKQRGAYCPQSTAFVRVSDLFRL